MNALHEVRSFLRASLVIPVAPVVPASATRRDPPGGLLRRRLVCAATLVAGAALLWWSLDLLPGDTLFYAGTLVLAGVWLLGALLAGPLSLGRARTRAGTSYARPVVQSLVLGATLLALFVAGAFVVAQVPLLRGPVVDLLDHARYGSLPLVLVVTVLNGVAEELFFRGALYAALPARGAVLVTTAVYALTTVVVGVPLLVLAALCVGLVCGLQRRVTGGVLGPVITHLTWSVGMLLLLPALLPT